MKPPLYLVTPDPESHTEAVKALCLMGGMRGERSLKKEPPFARKACARQALFFFARAGLGSSQSHQKRLLEHPRRHKRQTALKSGLRQSTPSMGIRHNLAPNVEGVHGFRLIGDTDGYRPGVAPSPEIAVHFRRRREEFYASISVPWPATSGVAKNLRRWTPSTPKTYFC